MLVKDIMNSPAICIDANITISETIKIMRKENIGFCPITKNDRLIGVVTDRDILMRSQRLNKNTRISKIMTRTCIYTISAHAPLEIAKKTMMKYNVKRLIVIYDDYIKGVISNTDINSI